MAITKFYKIITPQSAVERMHSSQDITGSAGIYGNYTWYNRVVNGSAQRVNKYREYDVMDEDVDVARALDIVAEEMAGNNPKNEEPLQIKYMSGAETYLPTTLVMTIRAALRTFCAVQELETRLFSICRQTVKYGDTFFLRPKKKNKKWVYCNPKNVTDAHVSVDDITDIRGWEIKVDNQALGSSNGSVSGVFNYVNSGTMAYTGMGTVTFSPSEVIRFTMYDDMDDQSPFGESILRAVYRTFKQKQLLEDAIIIYRIQRAPERRVYYIDVGKTPAHLVSGHLQKIKDEIKQKKIPTAQGGQMQVDSIYNPQSMSEDIFLPQRPDGSGSKVDVLPGGQNLGELQDLEFFFKKLWRGLRIPQSFMDSATEGGAVSSDGKVGIAYMQEIKFSLYIERLQKSIEKTLDAEFKKFLKDNAINVDETMFKVVLPEPTNYRKSRNQMMDNELLNNMSNANGIEHLSKRFVQMRYGQLSIEDMKLNERLLREEKGLPLDGNAKDIPALYNPESAEAGGFDGGFGGSSSGGGFGGSGSADDLEPFDDETTDEESIDATKSEDTVENNSGETPPENDKNQTKQ